MMNVAKVLVPVDLKAIAWDCMEYGARLAKRLGASLDLLYALEQPMMGYPDALLLLEGPMKTRRTYALDTMSALVDMLVERVSPELTEEPADELDAMWGQTSDALQAAGHVIAGDPVKVILEFALKGEHELIVMGGRGDRSSMMHWVRGGVAERIVRHAPGPVLVVPTLQLRAPAAVSVRLPEAHPVR